MKCLAARFLLLIFSITALCTFLLAHSFERTQSAPLSQATPANPEAISPFRTIDTIGDISAPHIGNWDEHSEARVFMDGYLLMGQAWGDYNNDGYIDLYVTGGQGASSLYENQGDGHFAHSAFADTVALPNSWTGGATWVDYNNDGWRDLYVLVHGVNVLFHNNEGTGFTDVTALAGVGDVGKSSTATWGDFDGDADLDLYVTNWSCYPACDPVDHTQAQDRFYRNNGPDDQGNITFTDVSAWFTEEKLLGAGFAATFVDIDDDRDPDLYVVNDKLQNPIGNVLWRNDGPNDDGRCGPDPDRWCWIDISETSGAMSGLHGMGLAIGDYDEDLDLDIYITNKERFGQLLQNDGSGTFVNGTTAANLPTTVTDVIGWGTTFFDYNNDGRLDLYAATTGSVKLNDLQGALGMHFPFANQLFHNDGGIFTDVTPTDWQTTPQPTVGIAYADYDNDGRLDLVRGIWNVGYELLHNQSPTAAANNWLRIQLIGGGPVNRDAVGTRVYVNLTGGRRLMQEVVNGSALGAGNDLTLHFGLGEERVISVMVVWPDGLKRIYPVVPHNQLWRVVYPTVKDDPVVTQLRDAASEPFVDVSVAAGIAAQHQGNWTMFKPGFTSGYLGIGQAWGDYNNDGWVDLYVTGNELPNVLFQNRGDGTFTRSPLSDDVALPNVRSGGVTWADYNNDGYTDLYVLNQGANTLFRNDNGTGFTDVTATTGVGDVGKGSSATWADYDGDGFLDLYVVNWSCHPECDPIDLTQAEDGLYHNNGDGTFTDVSALLAVERLQGAGFTASFGDFDDDGDADLYVINDALMNPIGNVYWRNDGPDTTGACGGWCWTDASAENGAGTVVEGMGLAIGDYDNDLDLDFYYSNKVNPGELLQNDAGRFVDVAGGAGIDTINGTTVGWGASFLDYDNDGWLDLFMATTEFRRTDPNKPPDGMHFGHPNLLFHNRGEANIAGTNAPVFTNVTPATWYEVPRASMGIAAADYDHDGRVDFVTGDWNSGYLLYRNVDPAAADGGPNNWFTVQLTGDGPINRDAVGARVYLTDSNGKKQLREVRIGSSLGAGEETALHFGLGDATIREVEVVWPDGLQITVVNLPVNQRWALTYPNRETEIVAIAPTTSPTAMATPPTPTTASTPTAPPMATATTVIAPPTTAPLPTMTPTTVPTVPLQPSPTTNQPITQSPITQSPITQSPITQSPITQLPPITGTQHNRTIQDNDALLATAWFDLYLQLIETTEGFAPPVAARAIGYGGVTFYEALVNGLPAYESLAGQLNGLSGLPQPQPNTRYHWPTVANSAMAQITKSLFSNTNAANQDAIDLLALQFADHYRVGLDAATFDRSVQFGRAVAVAIYAWSVTDGGHEAQFHNFASDYTSPVGDGMWQSTPPGHAAALLPHWSNNRPMVLRTDHACVAEPPIPYSTAPDSPFMALTQEVYDTVRHLTPEQYTIARFWADDPGKTPTPPGHSLAIATTILRQTNASLALAAETYARLGIAVNDAFIGCWQAKYQYNRIRPITAIQALIDPAWNNPAVTDPVLTPPFPEYTSGHSVQSGAVAEVLTSLFGDITFTDRTHVERGLLPRTFDSFWAMANEAAISRLYGGIHYRDAIDAGLVQGQCIGQQVVALQLRRE